MLPRNARVFVASQPVDFRGSFDRLAGFVRERLGSDPRSGDLYIFSNKGADKLKVLFFDQTGDCILYKRLDRRTFRGLVSLEPGTQRVEISREQFAELLRGLELASEATH